MDDLQMARGEIEGGYNLAIGEPVVLQEHLRFPVFEMQGPYTYPTMEGHSPLVHELERIYPGHHVVIANGAKQALLAAMWAMKEAEGKTWVHHWAPYWPSYYTLSAKMLKLWFHDGADWERPDHLGAKITCITSPNNPDGMQALKGTPCDIWDAVYAHGLYGWNGDEPNYRVRIGSAAKALGLSGARVGWALTRDSKLADFMRRYVEFTTSGVSLVSQEMVAHALEHMKTIEAGRAVGEARADMVANGCAFTKYLGKYCRWIKGFPADRSGMFAYFEIENCFIGAFREATERAKVLLVTGEACGDRDTRGSRWRMNMAHNVRYTEEALQALRKELERC